MAVGGEKSLNLSVGRTQQVQFRQNTPRASFSAPRTFDDLGFSVHLRSNEDSDGDAHGAGLGEVMTEYSDKTSKTNKSRNKLYALEQKHREAGRISKEDRIKNNNLGKTKINARKDKAQKQIRNIAFKSAHSVVDKANLVVSEDLTRPIAKKHPWKNYNRRM